MRRAIRLGSSPWPARESRTGGPPGRCPRSGSDRSCSCSAEYKSSVNTSQRNRSSATARIIRAASAGEVAELRLWPSFERAASRCSIRFRSVISLAIVSDAARPWNRDRAPLDLDVYESPVLLLVPPHAGQAHPGGGVRPTTSLCKYSIIAGTSSGGRMSLSFIPRNSSRE